MLEGMYKCWKTLSYAFTELLQAQYKFPIVKNIQTKIGSSHITF